MKNITLLTLLSVTLLLSSCAKDGIDYTDQTSGQITGELSVQMRAEEPRTSTSASTSASAGTKASADMPTIDQFQVDIVNTSGRSVKHWDTYTEIPEKVRLNVGKYTLRGSYGSPTASGFGKPYFLGESPFSITGQQTTTASTVCYLANTKVQVIFGPNFKTYYPEHKALIRSLTSSKSPQVTFGKGETRAGYFPAGNLQLMLVMTNTSGTTYSYIAETISASARDFITLRLDITAPLGTVGLSITTDTSTENTEYSIELPNFTLPKSEPLFLMDGFDPQDGTLTTIEGARPEAAKVNVRADGQIRECLVSVNSEELLAKGWPAEFDLANIDPATATQLKADGLKWFEGMNGQFLGNIDFSEVSSRLTTTIDRTTTSLFSVQVTDAFTQTVNQSVAVAVVPRFVLPTIPEGHVWARKAYVDVEMSSADPTKVGLEYNNGSNWVALPSTPQISTPTHVRLLASGLNPAQSYELRATYDGTAFITPGQNITTESPTQLPNSNFDSWHNKEVYYGGVAFNRAIYEYYPWTAEETDPLWATHNPVTTSQRNGVSTYYSSYSGTLDVAGRSGRAAEISTIGWGEGNTYAGSPTLVKNRTAGMLFVGSYDLGNWTEIFGKPFHVRPTQFSFYYKYAPQGGESFKAYAVVENRDNGTVELGRGELVSGSAQGSFTLATVDLTYTNVTLRATHMYVVFLCSTSGSPTTRGIKGSESWLGGFADARNVGSTLTIDDLELNY